MDAVDFKPRRRSDGQYAIEIFMGADSLGFVHWIESTSGRICRIDRADFVMSPCWNKKQAQANCNWLVSAYARGEVK